MLRITLLIMFAFSANVYANDDWRKSSLFLTDAELKALELKVAEMELQEKLEAKKYEDRVIHQVAQYLQNPSTVTDCKATSYSIRQATQNVLKNYDQITAYDIHTSYDEGRVLFEGEFTPAVLKQASDLANDCSGLIHTNVDDLKLFVADLFEMGWGVRKNIEIAEKLRFEAAVAKDYRLKKKVLPKSRSSNVKVRVFNANSHDALENMKTLCMGLDAVKSGFKLHDKIMMQDKGKILYKRKKAFTFLRVFYEKFMTCDVVPLTIRAKYYPFLGIIEQDGLSKEVNLSKAVLYYNYAVRNGVRREGAGYALAYLYRFGKFHGQFKYLAFYEEISRLLTPTSTFHGVLSEMELLGLGREKSLWRAKRHLRNGVKAGDLSAYVTQVRLDMPLTDWLKGGEINGEPIGKKTVPHPIYVHAVEGYPSSQSLMAYAVRLDQPNTHPIDNHDYLKWETKAACQGWPHSQALLAHLYLEKDAQSPVGLFWANKFNNEWSNSDLKFKSNKIFKDISKLSEKDNRIHFNKLCGR